jgi:hypothetical protein
VSLALALVILVLHSPGGDPHSALSKGREATWPPAARAASLSEIRPAAPALSEQYAQATDLRAFVDRHLARLDDPETAFYVAQALEECAEARSIARDEGFSMQERLAAAGLGESCRGFEGYFIEPATIVSLLRYAARWGEPHATARMLLFRDIAAAKDDVLPLLPWMLTSREPSIVREVGAFISRGEAQWRYGNEQVPTAVAAIAWELVACDLDGSCKPWGRFALGQCAFLGRCSAGRYEDAVVLLEPPELVAQALVLRAGILRALQDHDWEWLGLR